jgi:hypothetical protein
MAAGNQLCRLSHPRHIHLHYIRSHRPRKMILHARLRFVCPFEAGGREATS